MKLRDKKVLLLGATGGIGSACARQLAEQGARLVLVARSEAKLDRLKAELGELASAVEACFRIDFSENDFESGLLSVAEQHADIDYIVHALGVNRFQNYRANSAETLNALFEVNLFSLMHTVRILMPNLQQRKSAGLVVIGSTFGSIGYPGFTGYCASKFALRGYVESLRRELSDTAVDVLYIAPRATNTELNDARIVSMNEQLGNAVDSPQRVASAVLRAMSRKQLTSYIGFPERLFVLINGINSRLVDKGIAKQLPIINRLLAE